LRRALLHGRHPARLDELSVEIAEKGGPPALPSPISARGLEATRGESCNPTLL
jgi:hypothetical protein